MWGEPGRYDSSQAQAEEFRPRYSRQDYEIKPVGEN